MLAQPPVTARLWLTGTICLQVGRDLLREADLPARQGTVALAALALLRHRAAERETLADRLWADRPPAAWDTALRALL